MEECKCNKCGKLFQDKQTDIHNYRTEFGYFSNHDGEIWEFNLCEDCLEKLVSSFIAPPKKIEKLII
jgi:hypothetical protein